MGSGLSKSKDKKKNRLGDDKGVKRSGSWLSSFVPSRSSNSSLKSVPQSGATANASTDNHATPAAPASTTPASPAQKYDAVGSVSSKEVESASSNTITEVEYTGARLPINEPQRWDYLCSLSVLDTKPEARFDDITRLCCMIFKVPIALVSLVDKERQWFKSVQGLHATETDRKSSFCAWTLLPQHPEVLVVENALEDIRFRNNPLVVGYPHIRFYAGCPLVATNGLRLGSLCIIDAKPKNFDAESCNMLANLAEMVVREIEKEKMMETQKQRSAWLTQENSQLLRAIDCFSEGIMLCNLSLPRWPVMFVNEAWEKATGLDKDMGYGRGFWDIFKVPSDVEEKTRNMYMQAIQGEQSFELGVFYEYGGQRHWLNMQFRCANNATMDSYMPLVGIPSILASTSSHDRPCYYFATISSAPRASMEVSVATKGNPNFAIVDTKVDPFEDVKLGPLLGKGAYGRVYRGQWNGAQVAVKVLETVATDDGKELLEATLGSQVSHPNVVQTYKYCTRDMGMATGADDEGKKLVETWMIMEFCNKGSLSDAVDRGAFRKRHSLFEVEYKALLSTASEVASAMCYLHGRGIMHGDLTGNNVMLSTSDKDERKFTAKVADFGLSRQIEPGQQVQTKTYGTVTHMPPELLLDGVLTKSADVYAFGVIMWELYSGQRPYSGMSHGQIIHHITSGKMLSISASCPKPMREFIQRCCATDPSVRPTFPDIVKQIHELEQDLCG